jgi:hypothetical protein
LQPTHRTTRFSNIEIIGGVRGVVGEDGEWAIPRSLIKKISCRQKKCFYNGGCCTSKNTILSNVYDLKISPLELNPGKNTITITTESLRSASFIYGEILFVSALHTKMYISGSADDSILHLQTRKGV